MSAPLLSILIAALPERRAKRERLLRLLPLTTENMDQVEILVDDTVGISIGVKRQQMLERACGTYVAFVDDDDLVADDYVERVLAACREGADCCYFEGLAVFQPGRLVRFRHSITLPGWGQDGEGYYRTPNHLNAIRRDLALAVGYADMKHGEDHDFSLRIRPLLKTEAAVPGGPLYWYFADAWAKERSASLRFLIKWPTRGRPALFASTLRRHLETLSGKHPVEFLVTLDHDDETSLEVATKVAKLEWPVQICKGPAGRTKIEAINADMGFASSWDVLILVADDMVPVEHGWDERILMDFARRCPDLDGLLTYDDGFQKPPPGEIPIATMPVMGRPFYERQGTIYCPEYRSVFCDNELTAVAKAQGRVHYVPRTIIRHDWIGRTDRRDLLLRRNEAQWEHDRQVFERRCPELARARAAAPPPPPPPAAGPVAPSPLREYVLRPQRRRRAR